MKNACTIALLCLISLACVALLQLATLPTAGASSSPPLETGGWAKVKTDRAPAARMGHATVYDPDNRRVILFGGGPIDRTGKGRPRDDTWAWDGKRWTRLNPLRAPTPRYGHAMAYDARRKVVVMFGGWNDRGQPLRDLWEFDGQTWVMSNTRTAPPARAWHAMAADQFNQRITLFGGQTHAGALDDTWQWDGRLWQLERTGAGPEARFGHAMVYDPDRRVMIMFGGTSGGFPALNDTWQFDGTKWQQVETETHPPASRGHAMAFHPARNRVVLFGGAIVDQQQRGYQRTWLFDGNEWQQVSDALGPDDRSYCSLTYDANNTRMVLFGGIGRRGFFDDTWTHP
jgi:hypothetical protein